MNGRSTVDFARSFVPPTLLSLLRRLRKVEAPDQTAGVWNGVYGSWRDAPSTGEQFDSAAWYSETLEHTRRAMAGNDQLLAPPIGIAGENHALPLLASAISHGKSRITVLDFGGGMGIAYVHLRRSLPRNMAIHYAVVESKRLCEGGRSLFPDDSGIRFMSEFPDDADPVDIAYVCSALQYVEDYGAVLAKLCSYSPTHVLLVKFAGGETPTFVSTQMNRAGSVIPCWFVNVQEIVDRMDKLGYDLAFRGVLERSYDMRNLPAPYRLEHHCNLLFSRRPQREAANAR